MAFTQKREDDSSMHLEVVRGQMPETSESWPCFTRPDGTVVRCLINNDFLEMVVLVAPNGPSIDVDPEFIDINMIEAGLNRKVKVH